MSDPAQRGFSLDSIGEAVLSAAEGARIGVSVSMRVNGQHRVVFINDAAVEILGHSREEILRRSPMEILAPAVREEATRRMAARDAGQTLPSWYDTEVLTADGRHVPLHVGLGRTQLDGHPASVAFFTDITERQEFTKALARSERRFRALIECAPEAVWIFQDGRLVYANEALVKMLGYPSAEELLAVSPVELIVAEDRGVLFSRAEELLRTTRPLPPCEYRTRRYDGGVIVVEVGSMAVDWEGRPALLSFGRDVSARKEAETRLVQAERLAALGTLVAGIAHEINNPLTYALLSLEHALQLNEEPALPDRPERLRARLEEVRQGAERVAAIVRELRAFARTDADSTAPVDVREVVRAAIRFAHHELRHRARLELTLGDVPPIQGNGARLQQVFLNLLVNAAHAMPDRPGEANLVKVSVANEGDWVVAEVQDNGQGIAPEHLPRIFDPFFTTKAADAGTGLGLSICHRIVTSHGGSLDVRSRTGEGTTFRVRLPVTREPAPPPKAPAPAEQPPPPTRRERRRLLIVDDDAAVAASLARMLDEHYACEQVLDGHTALSRLSRPVDVILCDLMMPGMTGMDVYEEVARRHPGMERKFVFMTGGAFTTRAAEFRARTTNPVVEKPCTRDELLAALESV